MATEAKDMITFGPVDKSSVGLLRIIHRELLPVHYTDNIYSIVKEGKQAKGILAYYNNDTAVGEICFRREIENDEKKIYIMTLGVLKSYQRMGIATKLINKMMEDADDVVEVYLHVHVENDAAIKFYETIGFQQKELVNDYYKSLSNGNAYLYYKRI